MEILKSFLAILTFFALAVALAIALLKLWDRLGERLWARRARRHPGRQPGTPEYTARLLDPKIDELESHFGRQLPFAFKTLFRDSELIQRTEFYVVPPPAQRFTDTWHIAGFLPSDVAALGQVFAVGPQNLPFATDGFGDVYYVALDEGNAGDCPVYVYRHDGDWRERVADSLIEFLSWRRLTPQEADALGD